MIDSRFRTSGSTSDFIFDLAEVISLPPNTIAYVGDVCIPISWYTVISDVNDRLYFSFPSLYMLSTYIKLPQGSYSGASLAESIKSLLDEQLLSTGEHINVAYTEHTNLLTLALSDGHAFSIYSDLGLQKENLANFSNTAWGVASLPNRTASGLLNLTDTATIGFWGLFPDIRHIHQVLISSDSFGNHKVMGPQGSQNCIKRVPIAANFGEVSVYDTVNPFDFIECGNSTLSRLRFKITDVRGHVIDLNEMPVSFSIFLTITD